jgi:hypothetical protein
VEAEQILRLAIAKAPPGISRPRLLEIAGELGLSAEQVTAAEEKILAQEREERERGQLRGRNVRELRDQGLLFAVVSGAVLAVDIFLNRAVTWSFWFVLVWGASLASRAARVYLSGPEGREREYRQWQVDRARHPLSDEHRRALDEIFTRFPGQKLQAVREMRDRFNLGLREAKDVVDRYDELYPNAFLG